MSHDDYRSLEAYMWKASEAGLWFPSPRFALGSSTGAEQHSGIRKINGTDQTSYAAVGCRRL